MYGGISREFVFRYWQGKGQGSKEVRSEHIFVQCVLRVYSFSTKNPKFIREFLFNINIKKKEKGGHTYARH